MTSNGERKPPRPRIEMLTQAGSAGEAAAVVAAIERFIADTTPVVSARAPFSGWLRAALVEGVSTSPGVPPDKEWKWQ